MQIIKTFFPFFSNAFLEIRRLTTGSYGSKDSGEFNHRIHCLILRWNRICALTSPSAMFDIIPTIFHLLLGIYVKVYMYDPSAYQFTLRCQDELPLPDRSKVFGGSSVRLTFEVLYIPGDDLSSSRFLPLLPLKHEKARFLGACILDDVLDWNKFVKAQYNISREIPWGITSRPLEFTSKRAPSEDDFYNLDLKSAWETERWVEEDSEGVDEEYANSGGSGDDSGMEVEGSDGENNSSESDEDASPVGRIPTPLHLRGKGLMVAQSSYNLSTDEAPLWKDQESSSCQSPDIHPSTDLNSPLSASSPSDLLSTSKPSLDLLTTSSPSSDLPVVSSSYSDLPSISSPSLDLPSTISLFPDLPAISSPSSKLPITSSLSSDLLTVNSLSLDLPAVSSPSFVKPSTNSPFSDLPTISSSFIDPPTISSSSLDQQTTSSPFPVLPAASSLRQVRFDLVEDISKDRELELSPKNLLSLVRMGGELEAYLSHMTTVDVPNADFVDNVIVANSNSDCSSSNELIEDYSEYSYLC